MIVLIKVGIFHCEACFPWAGQGLEICLPNTRLWDMGLPKKIWGKACSKPWDFSGFPMFSQHSHTEPWYPWYYPLVNKHRPWKSPIFNGFTSLPTPTTARVELLIYQRVGFSNLDPISAISRKTSQAWGLSTKPTSQVCSMCSQRSCQYHSRCGRSICLCVCLLFIVILPSGKLT